MTTSTAPLVFDPYDYELHEDPYPTYARLRAEAPVFHSPVGDLHVVSRHADVFAVLRDDATFSNRMGVSLDASALPPGTHGAHIHMVGRCDAPDFTTAGGHWNPTSKQHGTMNPAGPHEGDLPNLIVGTDGRGTLAITIPGATMAGLLDADGSAMVVHAGADDLRTDPSGNSGGRIACGVFQAG